MKFNYFELNKNEYVMYPVGNNIPKCVMLLNHVGKDICERFTSDTKDDIVEALAKKYNIDKKEIENDVYTYVDYLTSVLNDSDELSKEGVSSQEIEMRLIEEWNRRRLPVNVFVELTYNCNLRCPHCYLQEELVVKEKFLAKEKVFKIIDDLEKLKTINVIFTGGEATLHPDILEILRYTTNKNMLVTLLTNGQLIDKAMIEALKDIPLYEIKISVYGNEEQHDEFVHKQGAFKQVKNVLTNLQKMKGIGSGAYVLTTQNCNSFFSVRRDFNENEIPVIFSSLIMPTTTGNQKPTDFRVTDDELLKKIYKETSASTSGTSCNAGKCRFRITPDGEVNPCEMLKHIIFGNINEQSFYEIFNSKAREEWITIFEKIKDEHTCNSCNKRSFCVFCPGLFYQENSDYNIPSKYTCFMAQIKKELAGDIEK